MTAYTLKQVLTEDNLYEAWLKVRENKGCAGVDGQTIEMFEQRLTANLDTLRSEVLYDTYRPHPLLRVMIQEPGTKQRPLSIPVVRDRVLQTAVAKLLTPLFEAEFEDCSFAYRKGRSVHMAVRRVIRYRDEGYRWVVDADIQSFFDEIDHGVLLKELRELVADKDILHLIESWIKARVVDGDRHWTLKKGVPQGSPISPLLSNLYLDHLDEALIDKNQRLVRFADDFLILCKDEKRAKDALELTEHVLNSLKLKVNRDKTRLVDFNRGFRFLGVDFVRSLAIKAESSERPNGATDTVVKWSQRKEKESHQTPAVHPPKPTAIFEALEEALAQHNEFDSVQTFSDALPDFIPLEATEPPPPSSGHDPRLRTLYLMEHGCVLSKESKRLVIKKDGETLREIPAIKVDQILVFGNAQITTPAMKYCLAEKIPIVLLSSSGRYHGVIDAFDTDPVLLHRDQFQRAGDQRFCLTIAKSIVHGKLANSRLVLYRQSRKRGLSALSDAVDDLKFILQNAATAETLDQLRGYEGAGAKIYFGAMGELLGETWQFSARKRRPPPDPVNAMLSYGYTLLFYNVYALLRARGMNPHVGFLHPLRSGHPALVSDLMEEFRSITVDAVVLSLALNNRIEPDDFLFSNDVDRPCRLSDNARNTFIEAFEKKMNAPLTHPVTGLHLDYRRCIESQVHTLSSVVRGHTEEYKPMVLR